MIYFIMQVNTSNLVNMIYQNILGRFGAHWARIKKKVWIFFSMAVGRPSAGCRELTKEHLQRLQSHHTLHTQCLLIEHNISDQMQGSGFWKNTFLMIWKAKYMKFLVSVGRPPAGRRPAGGRLTAVKKSKLFSLMHTQCAPKPPRMFG